jgi:hypothetical protein
MSIFNSKTYWQNRYKNRGSSGSGSKGNEAIKKSEYINNIIDKYNIKSVNDYGHGDCNQLKHMKEVEYYTGYDVSDDARNMCLSIFSNNKNYKFIDDISKFKKADLALSLDVIYHLIEDEVYQDYLEKLFSISDIVLIYSTDQDLSSGCHSHVKHRKFTSYIKTHFVDFYLEDKNPVARDEVSMHLYIKRK